MADHLTRGDIGQEAEADWRLSGVKPALVFCRRVTRQVVVQKPLDSAKLFAKPLLFGNGTGTDAVAENSGRGITRCLLEGGRSKRAMRAKKLVDHVFAQQ